MRSNNRGAVRSALPAAIAAFIAVAAPARADSTRDYVVKAGDTCVSIATRELGGQAQLGEFHRLNPQLGPQPHTLVAGQVLKLPVIEIKPDAELASPRGRVEVRRAGTEQWTPGTEGEDLFRTWRVGTRERAAATVKFADTSALDLRENTVIVIFGPSATQQRVLRTSVERGALRSRLAALDGGPRLAIETAGGTAELGGGSAVIDVDATGETRLSNHAGRPATLATPRGRVVVNEDHGSKAQRDRPPLPPRPLPPRPAWVRPAELVLSWKGEPTSLTGSWAPVAEAAKYRIEIARADTPTVAEARLEVAAAVTRLAAANLPPGEYVVRVSSVDAVGLESRPSDPLRVQLIEVSRPVAVTGATLTPPPGLPCRAGGEAPAAGAAPEPVTLVRSPDGIARVTCGAPGTATTLEIPLPTPMAIGPPLLRGKPGEVVRAEIAARGVAPEALRVTGRGAEVVSIEPGPEVVRVAVRAGPAGSIVVAIAGAAEPLLVIPVTAETAPPKVTARAGRPAPHTLAAIGLGGVTTGRGTDFRYGVEAEVTLGGPVGAYAGVVDRTDGEAAGELGLIARGGTRLRPFARLGVEANLDRADAAAGLGLELVVAPWLALRLQGEVTGSSGDTAVNGVLGVVISR